MNLNYKIKIEIQTRSNQCDREFNSNYKRLISYGLKENTVEIEKYDGVKSFKMNDNIVIKLIKEIDNSLNCRIYSYTLVNNSISDTINVMINYFKFTVCDVLNIKINDINSVDKQMLFKHYVRKYKNNDKLYFHNENFSTLILQNNTLSICDNKRLNQNVTKRIADILENISVLNVLDK